MKAIFYIGLMASVIFVVPPLKADVLTALALGQSLQPYSCFDALGNPIAKNWSWSANSPIYTHHRKVAFNFSGQMYCGENTIQVSCNDDWDMSQAGMGDLTISERDCLQIARENKIQTQTPNEITQTAACYFDSLSKVPNYKKWSSATSPSDIVKVTNGKEAVCTATIACKGAKAIRGVQCAPGADNECKTDADLVACISRKVTAKKCYLGDGRSTPIANSWAFSSQEVPPNIEGKGLPSYKVNAYCTEGATEFKLEECLLSNSEYHSSRQEVISLCNQKHLAAHSEENTTVAAAATLSKVNKPYLCDESLQRVLDPQLGNRGVGDDGKGYYFGSLGCKVKDPAKPEQADYSAFILPLKDPNKDYGPSYCVRIGDQVYKRQIPALMRNFPDYHSINVDLPNFPKVNGSCELSNELSMFMRGSKTTQESLKKDPKAKPGLPALSINNSPLKSVKNGRPVVQLGGSMSEAAKECGDAENDRLTGYNKDDFTKLLAKDVSKDKALMDRLKAAQTSCEGVEAVKDVVGVITTKLGNPSFPGTDPKAGSTSSK